MLINSSNDVINIFDHHFVLRCPNCNVPSNLSAISFPRYEYLIRFKLKNVGIVYRCDSCNEPVFLKFSIDKYDTGNGRIFIAEKYIEIEKAKEHFELNYLPESVREDFNEALISFSNSCYNAFASMCRRSIQSAFQELGAKGKDKVMQQLDDVKETTSMEDDTYEIIKQIIISGHDGTHPHLPKLSSERASILLGLMKDVLYQLFVRKAKIQEAIVSRKKDIQNTNE